jgi:hypothetical protein
MTTVREDALTLHFPVTWRVFKYDETPFYRNHAQDLADSKAVDVVAHEPAANALWLIELKDYRAHRRSKSMDLFDEIAIKVRDTVAGIALAQRRAGDAFCVFARTLGLDTPLRVALHLEQPAKPSKLYPAVTDRSNHLIKLRQKVRLVDPHAIVCEIGAMPASVGWTIT